MFLVDTNTKGISATKLDKLGWRASDTAEIAFDNVEIPVENLMDVEGKGFPYIMQHFAFERLIMAMNAHARAEYSIEYTIQHMSQREAFGKTIDKFQALRHKMVDNATEVEHCKIFNYAAAARLSRDSRLGPIGGGT
jgi:acyl-CoA dehydrogenase